MIRYDKKKKQYHEDGNYYLPPDGTKQLIDWHELEVNPIAEREFRLYILAVFGIIALFLCVLVFIIW